MYFYQHIYFIIIIIIWIYEFYAPLPIQSRTVILITLYGALSSNFILAVTLWDAIVLLYLLIEAKLSLTLSFMENVLREVQWSIFIDSYCIQRTWYIIFIEFKESMVGYKTFLPHTRDNAFFLYVGGGIGVGVGTLLGIGESDYNPDNVLDEKYNVVALFDIYHGQESVTYLKQKVSLLLVTTLRILFMCLWISNWAKNYSKLCSFF